ncbi:MAG: DegT/DnrJ/EryC1/StrS family aminotransferase [Deltaproteobacteria bacterium]|nr:DegT/DnrJ/EryC1/StrS family aminotransferase [Deltaproteobacteria bacterium]
MLHRYYRTLPWTAYLRHGWQSRTNAVMTAFHARWGAATPLFCTSSGRAALALTLATAGIGGADEVLVPQYLSHCVHEVLERYGRPAFGPSPRTRAVLVFHQWGFPQDFDALAAAFPADVRPLWIEDCAHVLEGAWNGVSVGDFGDVAFYSLPKLFSVSYAGVLRINRAWLHAPIARAWEEAPTLSGWRARWADWCYVRLYAATPALQHSAVSTASTLYRVLEAFPRGTAIRGAMPTTPAALEAFLRAQRNRFRVCLDRFGSQGVLRSGDDLDRLTPLVYPFFCEDSARRAALVAQCAEYGLRVDTYHFDVRRNLLAPDFRPCVPIPLHAGIPESVFQRVVRALPAPCPV